LDFPLDVIDHPLLANPGLKAAIEKHVGWEPRDITTKRRKKKKASSRKKELEKELELAEEQRVGRRPREPREEWDRVNFPKEDLNYRLSVDAVSFASEPVGLLFMWMLSQLHFAHSVRPPAKTQAQCTPAASLKEVELRRTLTPEPENRTFDYDFVAAKPPSLHATPPTSIPASVHVPFALDCVDLSAGAPRVLEIIISFLMHQVEVELDVIGYSKPNESAGVGLQRAFSVISYMVDNGIERIRLRPAGRLSPIPVTDGGTLGFVELSVLQPSNATDGIDPLGVEEDLCQTPPTLAGPPLKVTPPKLRRSFAERLPTFSQSQLLLKASALRSSSVAGPGVDRVSPSGAQARASPSGSSLKSLLAPVNPNSNWSRVSPKAGQSTLDRSTMGHLAKANVFRSEPVLPRRREVVTKPWANRP